MAMISDSLKKGQVLEMFSIAICDSDRAGAERVSRIAEQWLKENGGNIGSAAVFSNSAELSERLHDGIRYSLYIMETLAPQVDGLALGERIAQSDPNAMIVFVTQSDEHALRAYEMHALRYISKPADEAELRSALEFAYNLYMSRPGSTIFIKGTGEVVPLSTDEIMYIENNIRVMTYHLSDGRQVKGTRRNISFEAALEPLTAYPEFIQTHKSYFVNMRFISALRADSVVMQDGREIPISRKNLSAVRKEYMSFMRQTKA